MVSEGFSGYVNWVNPSYCASTAWVSWSSMSWERYVHEIDSNRPVVFLVDSNADGRTDHFVTAIGYGVVGNVNLYACYNTWDLSLHWFPFVRMAKGQVFGIYDATLFELTNKEAYCASKTSRQGQTKVSWTETYEKPCSFKVVLYNNCFRSAVVEVYDVTSGTRTKVFHESTIMRTQDAYPYGLATTGSVLLQAFRTYEVAVEDFDGPVGSYAVVYPVAS